jgi:hypothetical protein
VLVAGQTQQFIATGTFSDASTQTLQSVIWNSSNPSVAVVSNSPGNTGIVTAESAGSATLTAAAGNVIGSTSVSVGALVSLSIQPSNPYVGVGSALQFTATGTFSDGSTHDLTNSVTWSSSYSAVVFILNGANAQALATGSATVTASISGTSTTTSVTVPTAPSITSVSPTTGAAGTQVTISGANFGSSQGTGTVWLGSTLGTVASWSNTQITATVAPNAQSGIVQVQQGGVLSNTVPFNVNTATITGVSPNGGGRTVVTITGYGFGSAQGAGQVWLGTANGLVQSWSDTQVVAQVAIGSTSGTAMILQNGVMSNPVPFTVNTLQITSISPTSGPAGTSVTITGMGFGAVQGGGIALIGGVPGVVSSWSNTQIVATVASSAVTGVVIVEQNGVWSNAVTFTVPGSGTSMILEPNIINMAVGDTHTIQALSSTGQPITGLTWTTSNANIVSLSTDNSPILTAVAPGHVTITAGSASADVTVYAGALPLGTVIWSNPGIGQVTKIIPAVPSETGVADVFAVEGGDGTPVTVQAITADGTTAWTATLGLASLIPDFQGGLVVTDETGIRKLDGITGQAYPGYTTGSSSVQAGAAVVYTDGTILGLQTDTSTYGANASSAIGIDPTTGAQKFSIPLTVQPLVDVSGDFAGIQCGTPVFGGLNIGVDAIVAGDGYGYYLYAYPEVELDCNFQTSAYAWHWKTHVRLLRVSSDGEYSVIPVADVTAPYPYYPGQGLYGIIPEFENAGGSMISNGDTGVLLNWSVIWGGEDYINVSGVTGWAITNGTSVTPINPPLGGAVTPVLQRQDGTFVGEVYDPNVPNQWDTVAFDQSGNPLWTVPNDQPQFATADGGVKGQSGITYDQNGNATGQGPFYTQSWTYNMYQDGPLTQVAAMPTILATSFCLPDAKNGRKAVAGQREGEYRRRQRPRNFPRAARDRLLSISRETLLGRY